MEKKNNMSSWNVDTLKEHFEKILLEKDKAINIALAAAKEAVGVAEKNAEKWRDNANEWRQAMNDREAKFMQRSEFVIYKESTEKALGIEKTRSDIGQGKGEGKQAFWGYVVGAIGFISAIIALGSRFIN